MASAGPALSDPTRALAHDHGHLSALLVELRALVGRVERDELSFDEAVPELEHAAELLRDGMIEHFAREEEAFFPFIEERLPALATRAAEVREDHDAVCAKAARLCGAFRRAHAAGHAIAAASAELSKLEVVYAKHSAGELDLLQVVGAALDDGGRRTLARLLETI